MDGGVKRAQGTRKWILFHPLKPPQQFSQDLQVSQVTEATKGISWNGVYFVPFNEPKEKSSSVQLKFLDLVSLKNDIQNKIEKHAWI